MANPANNSIDWNGLIAFGGAVFTLLAGMLALLPLFTNRTRAITAPLDPLIKAILIEREAIDQQEWKERRLRLVVSYVYFAVLFLVEIASIFLIFFLPSLTSFLLITIFVYLITIIVFPLIPLYYLAPYFLFRIRFAKDAKFYIFQAVKIHVKGDVEYIFSKSLEALRGKRGQYIDVDFNKRKLETCLKWGLRKAPAKITVEIKPIIIPTPNCYSLTIAYVREDEAEKNRYDIDASSAFINQFIGKLLTKEASSGDKDNKPN